MKKKKELPVTNEKKTETVAGLKNDTHEKDGVKKGYNEKNPSQPQGAFIPDAGSKKN